MDIFKFAMKMEQEGKKYYEVLVEKTNNQGLKNIFMMLAKDEDNHCKIVENLKEKYNNIVKSESLKKANTIFTEMLKSDENYTEDISQIEAYKHACHLEDESIRLYEQEFNKATTEKEKEVFKMLIQEEKKHKLILENVIEFVSQPIKCRAVKTKDSDPEFARWDIENI